jgi:hypothetical protein
VKGYIYCKCKAIGGRIIGRSEKIGSATLELIDNSPGISVYQIRETQDVYPHYVAHILRHVEVRSVDISINLSCEKDG